jgi:prolyl-tRNA editing enzyme YbaK/EbsC (Cys-tRNA(Pro) deacylase)
MDERATAFRERAREEHSLDLDVREIERSRREVEDDGREVEDGERRQVTRSVVLMADTLVVAVVGGEVDSRALATLRGVHRARPADPEEFESVLGWPAGGVPPFCHEASVPVYVDESLMEHDTVWAMAGAPEVVFPIAPETLVDCADATVADIAV